MKKIFALLIVVATILAMVSCTTKPEQQSDGSATVADYNNAIAATTPTSAIIKTTYENTTPEVTLEGIYNVTYNVDGTATVSYKYEKLNSIGAATMKETVPAEGLASVNVGADGSVTGGEMDTTVAAAAVSKLNLVESKIGYVISMGTIDATIKAADTEEMLGFKIDSDVRLIMSMTADGKIGSYTINYSTPAGKAGIVCMFN